MLRVMIDTNIFISAFAFKGVPLEVLQHCLRSSEIEIITSSELFAELEEKFKGGRIERILGKNYVQQKAAEYLELIKREIKIIKGIKPKVTICRDENDNMLLDLAQQAEANFIITGDKDLLVIGKFEYTLIIQPGDFKKLTS